jgi:hypothetical protein
MIGFVNYVNSFLKSGLEVPCPLCPCKSGAMKPTNICTKDLLAN